MEPWRSLSSGFSNGELDRDFRGSSSSDVDIENPQAKPGRPQDVCNMAGPSAIGTLLMYKVQLTPGWTGSCREVLSSSLCPVLSLTVLLGFLLHL